MRLILLFFLLIISSNLNAQLIVQGDSAMVQTAFTKGMYLKYHAINISETQGADDGNGVDTMAYDVNFKILGQKEDSVIIQMWYDVESTDPIVDVLDNLKSIVHYHVPTHKGKLVNGKYITKKVIKAIDKELKSKDLTDEKRESMEDYKDRLSNTSRIFKRYREFKYLMTNYEKLLPYGETVIDTLGTNEDEDMISYTIQKSSIRTLEDGSYAVDYGRRVESHMKESLLEDAVEEEFGGDAEIISTEIDVSQLKVSRSDAITVHYRQADGILDRFEYDKHRSIFGMEIDSHTIITLTEVK